MTYYTIFTNKILVYTTLLSYKTIILEVLPTEVSKIDNSEGIPSLSIHIT